MNISLQLLFEESTKFKLLKVWERLSRLPGGRALVDGPYEPHITIGLFTEVELEAFAKGLHATVNQPFELTFASVGSFPTSEGTLFLSPIHNTTLLELHSKVYNLALKLGGAMRQPEFYALGNWVPHCSVAWRAPQTTIVESMTILLNEGFPQHATVNRIGMFHTPDDSLLQIVPLDNAE